MIIFGTRGYLYQLAMVTLLCGHCGNPSAHAIRKRVVKFTLFFVPLFPVSVSHTVQCTFCGALQKVTAEQAGQLAAQAPWGPVGPAGQSGHGSAPLGHQQPYQG